MLRSWLEHEKHKEEVCVSSWWMHFVNFATSDSVWPHHRKQELCERTSHASGRWACAPKNEIKKSTPLVSELTPAQCFAPPLAHTHMFHARAWHHPHHLHLLLPCTLVEAVQGWLPNRAHLCTHIAATQAPCQQHLQTAVAHLVHPRRWRRCTAAYAARCRPPIIFMVHRGSAPALGRTWMRCARHGRRVWPPPHPWCKSRVTPSAVHHLAILWIT